MIIWLWMYIYLCNHGLYYNSLIVLSLTLVYGKVYTIQHLLLPNPHCLQQDEGYVRRCDLVCLTDIFQVGGFLQVLH